MLSVVEKPTKENDELRTTLDEVLQRGAHCADVGTTRAGIRDALALRIAVTDAASTFAA